MEKILGVYATYSDRELEEALSGTVASADRRAYRAIFDEIEVRRVPPTFATSEAVERSRANVREAVRDSNEDAPDWDDSEAYFGNVGLTGDYVVRGIGTRVYIGFAYLALIDGVEFSGYAYLAGADRVLYFVESADEIGNDVPTLAANALK